MFGVISQKLAKAQAKKICSCYSTDHERKRCIREKAAEIRAEYYKGSFTESFEQAVKTQLTSLVFPS